MGDNGSASIWPEWNYFEEVAASLLELTPLTQAADPDLHGVLYPFLDSINESAETFQLLVSQRALRDSYVIARVIYETAINACFLVTDPAVIAERAHVHARQKALRNLVRKIEVAGSPVFEYKHSRADKAMNEPQHRKWLDEFTSRSGREITSWTPETVQQRLEVIQNAFGAEAVKGLAFGLLLYRHASEIAHGTLYGTLFSWGAMEPGRPLKSAEDLGNFRSAELKHLMKLVAFTLESLVGILCGPLAAPHLEPAVNGARTRYYATRAAERDQEEKNHS